MRLRHLTTGGGGEGGCRRRRRRKRRRRGRTTGTRGRGTRRKVFLSGKKNIRLMTFHSLAEHGTWFAARGREQALNHIWARPEPINHLEISQVFSGEENCGSHSGCSSKALEERTVPAPKLTRNRTAGPLTTNSSSFRFGSGQAPAWRADIPRVGALHRSSSAIFKMRQGCSIARLLRVSSNTKV